MANVLFHRGQGIATTGNEHYHKFAYKAAQRTNAARNSGSAGVPICPWLVWGASGRELLIWVN
jgi:hypothetical protein